MKEPPWSTSGVAKLFSALLDRPYTLERSLLADRWLAWVDQVQETKTHHRPKPPLFARPKRRR
jgi:hypothetical protein